MKPFERRVGVLVAAMEYQAGRRREYAAKARILAEERQGHGGKLAVRSLQRISRYRLGRDSGRCRCRLELPKGCDEQREMRDQWAIFGTHTWN
ncbi:hypothetical protein [Paraurantiacibacter namhicola]|uniref:hypothetical protein n=1 Tax=Paraurantiacibacter namhicola TaxID=645517 RepID=UPI0012EDF61D|nr:hypothetical protein [Paraurantiacibacter namhicola]